ncbi:MAG TPA: UrcA family protein [Phenylobacterium sp.]|jgi:UrcA family protein
MKIAAFACIALIACPALAAAQPPQPRTEPTTAIRYADLNLATPTDAAKMLKRIRRAAAEVCAASPGQDGNDIYAIEGFESCYAQSVQRAVAKLNAPLVTAALETRGGRQGLAQGR